MFSRIKSIIKKEFRQIARDKRTLGILLFIPAFMLVMFGYALNFDVKHISLAIYDNDQSRMSREFVQNLLHSEYFDLKYYLKRTGDIDKLMGEEKVRVAIVIPKDFSKKLYTDRETTIQVILDGANSTAAATTVGYLNAIIQNFVARGHSPVPTFIPPIDYRPRVWYNPELRSAKFLVPGLIGFILMVTAVISTSLSVVREKERGTMEQIFVSPIKSIELILGKTIPYIFISFLATVLILFFGYFLFDVVIKGSYLLLFIVTLVFLTGCLGLGLLISTIVETQQVAFMLAVLITMLPTFILSGFVFPIRNMPPPIQAVTYLFQARYFLVSLRCIILKGVGLSAFWDQVLFLTIFATITIGLSAVRMRKKRK